MEMALVNRFVASCAETRDLLSDYVEGDLQPRARRRVVRHLLMCRRCRAVLRLLKATIAGLNTLDAAATRASPICGSSRSAARSLLFSIAIRTASSTVNLSGGVAICAESVDAVRSTARIARRMPG